MKKTPVNIPASVLTRLKNIAEKERFDFNFLLVRYIQERFLSRLAVSGYVNKFVLKGGFLLLAYNIERARPTRDIDFLGVDVTPDRKEIERIIAEIVSIHLDDGVKFLPASINSRLIKEDADYEGIRVKLIGKIGSARNSLQIDLAFGDIVTPHPLQMDYPTLLDTVNVKVLAYSKESIVAEKFEAMVKLTTFNTRMKDFHDILFLSNEFDFTGTELQRAIRNTFERRHTSIQASANLLDSNLGDDPNFQRQWDAFKKRTRISSKEEFGDAFSHLRMFLGPVVTAELQRKTIELRWNVRTGQWV